MKNRCFSFPRFVHLCRKEMVESWRTYVLSFVLMYGSLAIAFIINGLSIYQEGRVSWYQQWGRTGDPGWDVVFRMFVIGLLIFGCLSASMVMNRMKSKTSRLSVLMTPVTPSEYFFSRWLIFTVGFLAFYVVAFMLADCTRVLFFLLKAPAEIPVQVATLNHIVAVNPFNIFNNGIVFPVAVLFYFFLQSFFVLGSSLCPKNSFLKTFAAGLLLLSVFGLIAQFVLVRTTSFYISDKDGLLVMMPVMTVATLANWVLAYYRFKESEIINRI